MEKEKIIDISFFNPKRDHIKREVKVASRILILWFLATFLVPIIILFTGGPDGSQSFLCHMKFLGFPFHYWLVAQGSTICYILLCLYFVSLWEKYVVRGE